MKYCGIDLHSNNSVVVVSDAEDRSDIYEGAGICYSLAAARSGGFNRRMLDKNHRILRRTSATAAPGHNQWDGRPSPSRHRGARLKASSFATQISLDAKRLGPTRRALRRSTP